MKTLTSLYIIFLIILSPFSLHGDDRELLSLASADLKQATESLKTLSEKWKRIEKGFKGIKKIEATAYCNSPICVNVPEWNDGLTATGLIADLQTIAVDPKHIPLGSIVNIEGMGWYVAEDKGGAIKGNKIDIFMGDIKRAREFGRKQIRVKVFKL